MTTAPAAASGLDERLTALLAAEPEALRDPYPLYRELRERSPVHELGPVVVLSRYADVRAAARDAERLSSHTFTGARTEEALARMDEQGREAFLACAEYDANNVAHSDGEQHDRLRRIAHRAFTPRRIGELRGSVERYTDELLEPLAAADTGDAMTFAYRLPLMVVIDLLGVPAADRELIHGWSNAIGASRGVYDAGPLIEARRAIESFGAYVHALVAELRATGAGTSLAETLLDAEQGERMTLDELTANLILFLFAGHETTTNLIGLGLLELLRHPAQWQLLCADPAGAAPGAVEELMRYVSPVQTIQRVAVADVELGGVTIEAGRAVIGFLGSANRDAEVFDRPDELDVARDSAPVHLGFGLGPHFCLGAALARLEAEVALSTLAARFAGLRLAADPDELRWTGNTMLRTVESLPVTPA